MPIYGSVNGVNKEFSKHYGVVDGVNKEFISIYVLGNGVNKQVFSSKQNTLTSSQTYTAKNTHGTNNYVTNTQYSVTTNYTSFSSSLTQAMIDRMDITSTTNITINSYTLQPSRVQVVFTNGIGNKSSVVLNFVIYLK